MADQLAIRLEDDPEITVAVVEGLACKDCGRTIAIFVRGDPECLFCMISRSGRSTIQISGWQIHRTSHGQVTINHVKQDRLKPKDD